MQRLAAYTFSFLFIIGCFILIFNSNENNEIKVEQLENTINTTMKIIQIPVKATKGMINIGKDINEFTKKETYVKDGIIYEKNWWTKIIGSDGIAIGTTSGGGGGGGFRGR